MKYGFFTLLLILMLIVSVAKSQPGSIDLSFNPGDIGNGNGDGAANVVETVSFQSDGKIIIGGYIPTYNNITRNNIVRINADGSLDLGFNPGTGANDEVASTAIQSDGKIIIAGNFTTYNGVSRNRIARINSDGTLDASFNPGTGANDLIWDIALQSDGKIIIVGKFTNYNGTARNRIARLNSDGTNDTGFTIGTGGNDWIKAVSLQSDGKIMIGGFFTSYNGTSRNRNARLNSNGTIDTGYNPGTGTNYTIFDLTIQDDGKIIIVGDFANYNGTTRSKIARINTDGTLDTGFSTGGTTDAYINTVDIQDDGKIIIAGYFTNCAGIVRKRIARLNTNGSVDTGFDPGVGASNTLAMAIIQDNGGILIGGGYFYSYRNYAFNGIARLNSDASFDPGFNPGNAFNWMVFSTSVQNDGKILVGGYYNSYFGINKNNATRINSDGSLDTTFITGSGPNNTVFATAIQPDGKVLIGGAFTKFDGITKNYIARLNTDGSIDTTFNTGTGASSQVNAICIQTDNKIIIGGQFNSFNGISASRIVRLNPDGSVDTTFITGTGFNNTVEDIEIQIDGKILAGGSFSTYNGANKRCIVRLNPDGSIDTGFNIGTGASNTVGDIFVQNDGKILIGGWFSSYNGTARNCIARINSDGSIDTGFNPGSGADNYVYSVLSQSNGKIVAAGRFLNFNGVSKKNIVGLNNNGSIDPSFNSGAGTDLEIHTMSLQSDGKIIIGGYFTCYNDTGRNRIMRITGSCTNTFNAITVTACDTFTINTINYTASGTYTQYLTNAAGCDSVITIYLTINHSATGDTTATACDSFTWYGNTYTLSEEPIHTFTNSAGCDSVVTLHLTIETSPGIDMGPDTILCVNDGETSIVLNAGIAETYLWGNGASGQYLVIDTSEYPVLVNNEIYVLASNGNCFSGDTINVLFDICSNVATTTTIKYVNVYPNPAKESVVVEGILSGAVEISEISGKMVIQISNTLTNSVIDISKLPVGIYIMKIQTNDGVAVKKLVKE